MQPSEPGHGQSWCGQMVLQPSNQRRGTESTTAFQVDILTERDHWRHVSTQGARFARSVVPHRFPDAQRSGIFPPRHRRGRLRNQPHPGKRWRCRTHAPAKIKTVTFGAASSSPPKSKSEPSARPRSASSGIFGECLRRFSIKTITRHPGPFPAQGIEPGRRITGTGKAHSPARVIAL